jgi:hypothetical protein
MGVHLCFLTGFAAIFQHPYPVILEEDFILVFYQFE